MASSAEDLSREDLLWEDTKLWVGYIWKRHITAKLRQQIKTIRDKQKQPGAPSAACGSKDTICGSFAAGVCFAASPAVVPPRASSFVVDLTTP